MNDNSLVRKVLFIDDDLLTVEWVTIFLKSQGFEIKTASSVSGAMEALTGWLPDVVLSDLSLKDQHAFALLDQLAAADQTKNIPVVAITGHTLEAAERDRFHGYLKKPVEAGQLLTLIRSIFAGRIES